MSELLDSQGRRDQDLKLVPAKRKCLHYYFYYLDREFGLMHVRLESWLPFSIQVYVNGRAYLARRMEKAGISFESETLLHPRRRPEERSGDAR